jgi:hypothetical protein
MKCLRPLKHWDSGFESHSRHRCLFAFPFCLCCPVLAAALRQAWSPFTESYQLSKIHTWGLILMASRPQRLIRTAEEDCLLLKLIIFLSARYVFALDKNHLNAWLTSQPRRLRRYFPPKRRPLSLSPKNTALQPSRSYSSTYELYELVI